MNRFSCIYSYQCDVNCINCCLKPDQQNLKSNIDYSQIVSILNNFSIQKNDIFEISGGEPTLDKDYFLQFIEYLCNNKKFDKKRINLLTHAQKFSSKCFAEEASENLGHVTSTFYSPNGKLHDYFTQVDGSFEKKISGLNNLLDCGVDLHLKILTNNLNFNQLDEYMDLCNKYFDNSHIIIGWISLVGNAWNNRELLKTNIFDLSSYIENAIEKARETSINLNLTIPLCAIDPYYLKGHLPGDLKKGLDKVVIIKPDCEVIEQSADESQIFGKPSKRCDECIMREKCIWDWEGYEKYWDINTLLKPIH